jgi:hypothetical protein
MIRTSARKKAPSSVGLIQAAEPSSDLDDDEKAVAEQEDAPPRYYPFAPRLTDDGDE